jgi:hypothetical protein
MSHQSLALSQVLMLRFYMHAGWPLLPGTLQAPSFPLIAILLHAFWLILHYLTFPFCKCIPSVTKPCLATPEPLLGLIPISRCHGLSSDTCSFP